MEYRYYCWSDCFGKREFHASEESQGIVSIIINKYIKNFSTSGNKFIIFDDLKFSILYLNYKLQQQ